MEDDRTLFPSYSYKSYSLLPNKISVKFESSFFKDFYLIFEKFQQFFFLVYCSASRDVERER